MARSTDINANINADPRGFKAGLNKADKYAADWGKRVSRQLGGLNKAIIGFGTLAAGNAGVSALDELARASISAGDEIGKAAKTAGIGTASLQEYRYAAELTGQTQKQLDDALGRYNRRLGEARNGNKAYAESFKTLGVDINDTNEQALAKTFETLAGIEDFTVRTSIATKVFGDDARRMALIVGDGNKSLADMRREARDLGLVLGDDVVAGAEAANDQLTRIDRKLQADLQAHILENVDGWIAWKEAVGDATRFVVDLAAGIGTLADKFDRLFDRIPGAQIRDDARLEDLEARRRSLTKRFERFDDLRKNTNDSLDAGISGAGRAIIEKQVAYYEGQVRAAAFEILSLDRIIEARKGELSKPVDNGVDPPPTGGGAGGPLGIPGIKSPTLKSEGLDKIFTKELAPILESVRTPLEEYNDEVDRLLRLQKLFPEHSVEVGRALDLAGKKYEEQNRALILATDEWAAAQVSAVRGISDAFARAALYGEDLLDMLKRLALQLAAQKFSGFLFNTIGGALGLPIAGARADGGSVAGGLSYLVGEHGPEVFTPGASGFITPNEALGGGASIHIEQHNHFDASLEGVADQIAKLTPGIAAATMEQIDKMRSRPRYA